MLREARERRGESLEEVAVVTGIKPRYLKDLEGGDASFEPYPGRVYGRFFLREYAEHLGLDPEPMVEAFDGETEPVRPLEPSVRVIGSSSRSFPRPFIAIVGVVLLLIGAAVLQGSRDDPSMPDPRVSAASTRSDLKPAFAAKRPPAHEAPLQGIRAVLNVSAARCWIEAISDGTTSYRATAEVGTVVRFRADRRLELTLGNPGGVDLIVNGQPAATGSSSEPAHLVFVLRGSEVVPSLA